MKVRLHFHHDPDVLDPVKNPLVIGYWAKLSKKQLERGKVDLYGNGEYHTYAKLFEFNPELIKLLHSIVF